TGKQQEGERRHFLRSAADCYVRGGELQRAVDLLVATGETKRAAELVERAGDKRSAARRGAGAAAGAASAVTPASRKKQAAARLEQDGKLDLALDAYVEGRLPAEAARVARKLKRFA